MELFTLDPIDGYLEHWGILAPPFECREDAEWLMQKRILITGLDQNRYRVRLVTVPGDQGGQKHARSRIGGKYAIH